MLYLKCSGQVVSIDKDERFADKYINANTVHWEFCERWNGMAITAQFTQDGNTYNVLVDEVTYTTTLPNEIVAGEVDISAFGVHPETGVRITTVPVKKKIDKSGFIGDGETVIPPTPDLYAQLIAKIDDVGEIPVEEIENAVNAYMDENHIQTGATPEQAAQIEANREAIENYVPPVTSVNGMTGDVVIEAGGEADSVRWENVTGKPSAYTPAEHEHTWNDVKEKPSEFPPESHSHDWSDVTGKPETYPPSEHEHSYNDLNDKPTIPVVPKFLPNPYALTINGNEYDGSEEVNVVISAGGGEADSVAWDNVTGKPSTYPPESHSHAEYATTGALDQLSEHMSTYQYTVNVSAVNDKVELATCYPLTVFGNIGFLRLSFHVHSLVDVHEGVFTLTGFHKNLLGGGAFTARSMQNSFFDAGISIAGNTFMLTSTAGNGTGEWFHMPIFVFFEN